MNQEKTEPKAPSQSPIKKSSPQRPWRDIAVDVLRETDHEKILELARQLCDAVDEQVLKESAKQKKD